MSQHHPSCTPNDRQLVWLCAQCGGHESAEHIETINADLLKACNDALFYLTDRTLAPMLQEKLIAAINKAEGK